LQSHRAMTLIISGSSQPMCSAPEIVDVELYERETIDLA